jgi:SpoVK/Ycf46/Vps4 family AAA+-type ATPase
MAKAEKLSALVKSHVDGNDQLFYSIAMQLAAEEARLGHAHVARELRDLIEHGKNTVIAPEKGLSPVPLLQPKGELANLLSVKYPETSLSDMVLPSDLEHRLDRVLLEQRQSEKLLAKSLSPRRKLLLVGPPGSGKTLTASALAGELRLPLFTILLEGVITKFLGETAAKLRLVFEAINAKRAVYLFDEFDAVGSRRSATNDVGEIRRVLNSFLQMLENDQSQSVIIAATNHPELLDTALFRRFDDVLIYELPDAKQIELLFRSRLAVFNTKSVKWSTVVQSALNLSRSDVVKAAEDAAKATVLRDDTVIDTQTLLDFVAERRAAAL